jgi:hypothetical protein
MHDNQIKLINMNLNKYPSSCRVLHQKGWWIKLGIKFLLKQLLNEAKCIQAYHHNLPLAFVQKFALVLYRWLKESTIVVPYW